MRRWAWVLIIVGLAIAAYPLADKAYVWVWQRQILGRLDRAAQVQPDAAAVQDYTGLQTTFEHSIQPVQPQPDPAGQPDGQTPSTPSQSEPVPSDVLGTLKIPRIKLNVPIFKGATDSHMRAGVGQIAGTSPLGEIGNAALAAHRRYTFKRLPDVQLGDEITVETGTQTLKYRVYEKLIVEPTEVSVLNRNSRDTVLTLITCTPADTFKQRLIIHALLITP